MESFGLQDPLSRFFMGASWGSHRILASFRRSRWCWRSCERPRVAGIGAISGDGACSTGSTPVFQNLHFRRTKTLLFVRFGFSSLYLKSLFELLELRHDSLESFGLQDLRTRIFIGASWSYCRIRGSFRRSRWCWGSRGWLVLVPFPEMVPAPPAPLQF